MVDYVLELRTVQTHVIKTLIEALKEILTDASIEYTSDGLKLIAMDSTNTILVHLKLHGDKFEKYVCKRNAVFGISMINFHKIIKTISNDDTLSIYIDDTNPNVLKIISENAAKKSITTYELNLIDLDSEQHKFKDQTFDSVITMPSLDFQKICKDMYNLSETIEIKNVGSQLIFSCNGDFAKQETVFNQVDNTESRKSDSNQVVQGYYNLKYLVLFSKFTTLCQSVKILMRNNFPLTTVFNVGSLGELKMVLAPKIDNN